MESAPHSGYACASVQNRLLLLLRNAYIISKQQIFKQEQLIEIYRCCSDTLDAGFDLTAEQEKCIRGIQEQIAIAAPDALDRIREQEQHLMEPYNQEPIM